MACVVVMPPPAQVGITGRSSVPMTSATAGYRSPTGSPSASYRTPIGSPKLGHRGMLASPSPHVRITPMPGATKHVQTAQQIPIRTGSVRNLQTCSPYRNTAAVNTPGMAFRERVISAASSRSSLDVSRKASSQHVDEQVVRLCAAIDDAKQLESYTRALLQEHDADQDGAVCLDELVEVIKQLHRQIGVDFSEDEQRFHTLLLTHWHRFDLNGDGLLHESELFQFLRWMLWRKQQCLDPLRFKRKDLISSLTSGKACDHYDRIEQLGEGAFGVATKVVHRQSNTERVMKTVNKEKARKSSISPHEEISTLALLDHPHILRVYEHYEDSENIFIISDICYGGELVEIVKSHQQASLPMPEPWLARLFSQILEAIGYCHGKGVMHKDLKFQNVMLRNRVTCQSPVEDIHAVVIDFGISDLFGPQHGKPQRSTRLAGSLATMAPQVVNFDCSSKCDIWSIGCLLYACLNLSARANTSPCETNLACAYPFVGQPSIGDPQGMKALVANQRRGPNMANLQYASLECRDSVIRMLTFEEELRPTAADALKMQWFVKMMDEPRVRMSPQEIGRMQQQCECGAHHWWKAMAATAVAQLPASVMASKPNLYRLFRQMDSIGLGSISCSSLARALQEQGLSKADADQTAGSADLAGSGSIEWSEFVAAMLPSDEDLFKAALSTAFQAMDVDNDGFLTQQDICRLLASQRPGMQRYDRRMTQEAVADMMLAEFGAGKVDFPTFCFYFTLAGPYSISESKSLTSSRKSTSTVASSADL